MEKLKKHSVIRVHMGSENKKTVLKKKQEFLKKEGKEDTEKEEKEVLEVGTGNDTCQTMEVALWVKKMSNNDMDEFIDFMEELGFRYVDYREPNNKDLKKKVIIVFFSYNSCEVCRINGVERPLSMDLAMLDYINAHFPNKVYDFHNINPRCNYIKVKNTKGVRDLDGGESNGRESMEN